MYVIYEIRNIINNKFYIGSTKNFKRRVRVHKNLLKQNKHHSRYLQNAWNKYSEFNFVFKILQEVNDIDVYLIENNYIEELKPEYNMMKNVFSHIGIKRTPETCKNISNSLLGKIPSLETKEKLRQFNLGKKQSSDTIIKRVTNQYKPIIAYNMDGTIFKEFKSVIHASKELNFSANCIYRVIRGTRKNYRKLIWKQKEKN